jgi:acyl carrier protein
LSPGGAQSKELTITESIFRKVQSCIAESLAIKEEQIKPEARLIDDLGADSLDFLDMIFGLEKAFGVRLRDTKLDLLVRADFSQAQLTTDGFLAAESLAKLSEWLPELKGIQKITMREVYSHITVNTLVRLVEEKVHG